MTDTANIVGRLSEADRVVSVRVDELVEYVRHHPECPSINGNGDGDCTCGAVAFLNRVLGEV
jgi:hypothetical protein